MLMGWMLSTLYEAAVTGEWSKSIGHSASLSIVVVGYVELAFTVAVLMFLTQVFGALGEAQYFQ